jgi:hypothetical protein
MYRVITLPFTERKSLNLSEKQEEEMGPFFSSYLTKIMQLLPPLHNIRPSQPQLIQTYYNRRYLIFYTFMLPTVSDIQLFNPLTPNDL